MYFSHWVAFQSTNIKFTFFLLCIRTFEEIKIKWTIFCKWLPILSSEKKVACFNALAPLIRVPHLQTPGCIYLKLPKVKQSLCNAKLFRIRGSGVWKSLLTCKKENLEKMGKYFEEWNWFGGLIDKMYQCITKTFSDHWEI